MPRNTYNDDFKRKIVDLFRSGKSRQSLMKKYGISSSNISQWLNLFPEDKSAKSKFPLSKLGIFIIIILPCILIISIFLFIFLTIDRGVEKKNWQVATQCDFSIDGGETYSNTIKEFNVDSTVYMKVLISAETDTLSKKTQKPIGVVLKIPNVKEISANYDDGQPITGIPDEVNHVTVYNFNVMGSKKPKPAVCIFQFKPNEECDAKISLEYDEQINQAFDIQKTIHFVN